VKPKFIFLPFFRFPILNNELKIAKVAKVYINGLQRFTLMGCKDGERIEIEAIDCNLKSKKFKVKPKLIFLPFFRFPILNNELKI